MKTFVTVLRDIDVRQHGRTIATIQRGERFKAVSEGENFRCGYTYHVLKNGLLVSLLACEVEVCGVSESLDLAKVEGPLPPSPSYCSAAETREHNNCPIEGDPVNLF